LSDKSDIALWPVFLAIYELPLNDRFCFNNVIIAGLSVGPKPKFSVFLKPIIDELVLLEFGSFFDLHEFGEQILSFYGLCGVFDKPARGAILNVKVGNCYFGCLKCLQGGKAGKPILYPLCLEDPCGPKRTIASYNVDVETSRLVKDGSRGVKGACALSRLKFFEPIVNANIDYMHSVLEGVVCRLLSAWFEQKVVGVSIHTQIKKDTQSCLFKCLFKKKKKPMNARMNVTFSLNGKMGPLMSLTLKMSW